MVIPEDEALSPERLKELRGKIDPEVIQQVMPLTRGVITLMFTDIVVSTNIKAEMGDQPFFQNVFEPHNRLVRDCISKHNGHELKTIGDAFFAAFFIPADVIGRAVGRAMRILSDATFMSKDKKKERVNRLREIVDPLFDFEEMAKRVLGLHWGSRTPTEQRDFVALFRRFLEKIYADRSDSYDGEKIIVSREAVDKHYAQVDSKVINRQGEEFSVVYRLRQTDGEWKVYDIVVEGISIVKNYRSQFHRVITKSSYEELIKRIKEKAG